MQDIDVYTFSLFHYVDQSEDLVNAVQNVAGKNYSQLIVLIEPLSIGNMNNMIANYLKQEAVATKIVENVKAVETELQGIEMPILDAIIKIKEMPQKVYLEPLDFVSRNYTPMGMVMMRPSDYNYAELLFMAAQRVKSEMTENYFYRTLDLEDLVFSWAYCDAIEKYEIENRSYHMEKRLSTVIEEIKKERKNNARQEKVAVIVVAGGAHTAFLEERFKAKEKFTELYEKDSSLREIHKEKLVEIPKKFYEDIKIAVEELKKSTGETYSHNALKIAKEEICRRSSNLRHELPKPLDETSYKNLLSEIIVERAKFALAIANKDKNLSGDLINVVAQYVNIREIGNTGTIVVYGKSAEIPELINALKSIKSVLQNAGNKLLKIK